MATNFLTKIFGSRNDRLLKQYRKTVERINAMEPAVRGSDDERAARQDRGVQAPCGQWRERWTLCCRSLCRGARGSKRVMKMRHFDVQLAGWHVAAQRQDF
jgi:preprotein translocase subunit SecA